MAGKKTQAKNQVKDKKPDVLTDKICTVCGSRMLSKEIRNTLSISFVGAKSVRGYSLRHAKCS